MAVPALDEHGFLPVGYHNCSLDEISETFCYSLNRAALFAFLCGYLELWRASGLNVPIYVDGGFVTRKAAEPEDIDLVIDITKLDLRDPATGRAVTKLLDNQSIRHKFHLDVYPYHAVIAGVNDLRAFFSYVKPPLRSALGLGDDFRKGLLRVHI